MILFTAFFQLKRKVKRAALTLRRKNFTYFVSL